MCATPDLIEKKAAESARQIEGWEFKGAFRSAYHGNFLLNDATHLLLDIICEAAGSALTTYINVQGDCY